MQKWFITRTITILTKETKGLQDVQVMADLEENPVNILLLVLIQPPKFIKYHHHHYYRSITHHARSN
jgi:hypothetical protein